MKNKKGMYLGAVLLGALLIGTLGRPVLARTLGFLYGNALWVEAEPRSATPDVTVGDNDVYVKGTLEVDSTSRFDGAMVSKGITATGIVTASTMAVSALIDPIQGTCTTGTLAYGALYNYKCVAAGWLRSDGGTAWTLY